MSNQWQPQSHFPPGPDFTQEPDRDFWTAEPQQPGFWEQEQAAQNRAAQERRSDPAVEWLTRAVKITALAAALLFLTLCILAFLVGFGTAVIGGVL